MYTSFFNAFFFFRTAFLFRVGAWSVFFVTRRRPFELTNLPRHSFRALGSLVRDFFCCDAAGGSWFASQGLIFPHDLPGLAFPPPGPWSFLFYRRRVSSTPIPRIFVSIFLNFTLAPRPKAAIELGIFLVNSIFFFYVFSSPAYYFILATIASVVPSHCSAEPYSLFLFLSFCFLLFDLRRLSDKGRVVVRL